MVQVVSMEEVMIKEGWTTFQSKDVIGAVCSGDFELERRAKGESFCKGGVFVLLERVRVLD